MKKPTYRELGKVEQLQLLAFEQPVLYREVWPVQDLEDLGNIDEWPYGDEEMWFEDHRDGDDDDDEDLPLNDPPAP